MKHKIINNIFGNGNYLKKGKKYIFQSCGSGSGYLQSVSKKKKKTGKYEQNVELIQQEKRDLAM